MHHWTGSAVPDAMNARKFAVLFTVAALALCCLASTADAARMLQQQVFQANDLVQTITYANEKGKEQAAAAGQAIAKALATAGDDAKSYVTALAQAVDLRGCEVVAGVLQQAQQASQLQGRGSAFAAAFAPAPQVLQCLYPDCSTKPLAKDCCSTAAAEDSEVLVCSSYMQISSVPRVFESVLDNKDKCSCALPSKAG